ncbi:MAG: hypothetical protein K9K67_14210 [Bacteriovoracaceae bacterium]|nr:hypothetical protein [Bacteriovoracaceae bacterium]
MPAVATRIYFFLMRTVLSAVLFLVILNPLIAQEASSNHYYDSVFLGEKDFDQYQGPLDPSIVFQEHFATKTFLDELFEREFFFNLVSPQVGDLRTSWFEELPGMSSCPNFYLNENIEYIRYLYRLISISYLFESLKEHAIMSYKIGIDGQICDLDWKEVFGQCAPEGQDMKNFVRRTKYRYLLEYDPLKNKQLKGSEIKSFLENKNKSISRNEIDNIVDYRLKKFCLENDKCSMMSIGNVKKALAYSCQKDKSLIKMFCSEKDMLFGISVTGIPRELLVKSNVMRVINEGGFAESCLKRYAKLFKSRETEYSWLNDVFIHIRSQIEKEKREYAQGEIFLPGALKEFDDRGLSEFLFVAPTPVPTPVPTPLPTSVPTALPKVTATPMPIATAAPTPRPTPVPTPEPEPIPSQFEVARMKLIKEKLDKTDVNMEAFKDEFTFSGQVLDAIATPLKDFQTRSALEDLKRFDKLGTKKQPVRLLFLKLLIDQEAHKGLWNIVSILGDTFYVINDLERKSIPVVIKLHNDRNTQHQWQITILKESEYLNNKKGLPKKP